MAKYGIIAAVIFCMAVSTCAGAGEAQNWYDFAMFAYEEGNYDQAAGYLKKALEADRSNPDYHHLMGKILIKTGRYYSALSHLGGAFRIEPDLPELKFDMAYCHYKLNNFRKAADLFSEIAKTAKSQATAAYLAGICWFKLEDYESALPFFNQAIQTSPTVAVNGRYYAGVSSAQTGRVQDALDYFDYVIDHAETEDIRASAREWRRTLMKTKVKKKPYYLFLKLSFKHDDNVRLFSFDDIIEEAGTDEDDQMTGVFLSGAWDFLDRNGFTAGAGYSHYQSWCADYDEFNLMAGIFDFYVKYHPSNVSFSIDIIPSYFNVDSESYLRSAAVKPAVNYRFTQNFNMGVSYRYAYRDYEKDERDGAANGGFINLEYLLWGKSVRLFAESGYEYTTADYDIYAHDSIEGGLITSVNLPWKFGLEIEGRYCRRVYDETEPGQSEKREDDDFFAGASISREIGYEWLTAGLEYEYSQNDSNLEDYSYDQNIFGIFISGRY